MLTPTPTPIPPPPAPVLTAPDNGVVVPEGAPVALNWTGSGSGIEYMVEVNGGPSGSGSIGPIGASAHEIGPLPAGYAYTWRVRARGPGGDGPWSEPRDLTVRLATPSGLQASALSCSEVRLSWQDHSASEDGYRIYRDGAAVGETDADVAAVVVRGLSGDANHQFTVRALRATHQSVASNVATVATPPCDTLPPTSSWLSPDEGATIRQPSVVLDIAAEDAGAGIERIVLRGRWAAEWHDLAAITEAPFRYTWDLCAAGVPDGAIELRARVLDRAGNETIRSIGIVKRVNCGENQPPEPPRIVAPAAAARVTGLVPIVIEASDSYDTREELQVEVRIDDGAWTAAAYDPQVGHFVDSWDTTGAADGSHVVRARATDSGGLTTASGAADRVELVVDNVDDPLVADAGPDQTLVDLDGSGDERATLDARGSSHDPQRAAGYAWEDRWDGRPAVPLGSGQELAVDLGVGAHVITLTVTDSLGNRADDRVSVTIAPRPDTEPPAAAWVAPAAGAVIASRSVAVGASFTDSGGSGFKELVFRGRWGGDWYTLSTIRHAASPVGFQWDVCAAGVPDGTIELALRAVDNAGNQFEAPTRSVTKRFACVPGDPSLRVSPSEGARGEAIQIVASGFAAGETVTATLTVDAPEKQKKKSKRNAGKKGKKGNKKRRARRQSPSQDVLALASAQVTTAGSASLTFTVPDEAVIGAHRVELTGSKGSRASAPFAVLAGAARSTVGAATSTTDNAADAFAGAPVDRPGPSPVSGNGSTQALLPTESTVVTAAPSKRKPARARDKNDDGKDKPNKKQARIGDRRTKRQSRR